MRRRASGPRQAVLEAAGAPEAACGLPCGPGCGPARAAFNCCPGLHRVAEKPGRPTNRVHGKPDLPSCHAGVELKKALAERVLNAEIDDHLDGEAAAGKRNIRNGYSKKTVLTETSKLDLRIPRDREGTFDPKLIARYQRRFPGFDEKIVSMYARGMTVREIQGHLLELYGLEVSPDLISTVTDAVLETVAEWQNRPLEPMYPLVFFDALRVKIRDEGLVRNKAVYVALGVTPEGTKDILGLWIETSEGAKFWLRVMTELKNRGVEDILIAVVDGLKGFPEAIAAVFPPTIVQTCIVHLIRNSMDFASWKDRKPIAAELKAIYLATDADVARGRWWISTPASGAANIRRSRRAGGETGSMSSRSSPFPSLCGASFTSRTPSNP